MGISLPLAEKKKMTVICRVEPGCLGPAGADHIEAFCPVAAARLADSDGDVICWQVEPRYDKSLPEMECRLGMRQLSHDQAERFLALFNITFDDFQTHFDETLSSLIDDYFQR